MSINIINTLDLVHEIHIRPPLWAACNDRALRQRCWDEVCKALFPQFDLYSGSKKHQVATLIQKRWRTARDAYIRNRRKIASNIHVGRNYVYSDHLEFLEDRFNSFTTFEKSYTPTKELSINEVQSIKTEKPDDDHWISGADFEPPTQEGITCEVDLPNEEESKEESIVYNVVELEEEKGTSVTVKVEEIDVTVSEEEEETVEEETVVEAAAKEDLMVQEAANKEKETVKEAADEEVPLYCDDEQYQSEDEEEYEQPEELVTVLKEHLELVKNDDMAFLMSILPMIENFTGKQKKIFRTGVLKRVTHVSSIGRKKNKCFVPFVNISCLKKVAQYESFPPAITETLKEHYEFLKHSDMKFFMSVLQKVRHFSNESKIMFRSEVLKIVLRVAKSSYKKSKYPYYYDM